MHLYSYIRILLYYKYSTLHLINIAERSKALIYLSWSDVAWVQILLQTYFFILNFQFRSLSVPNSSTKLYK